MGKLVYKEYVAKAGPVVFNLKFLTRVTCVVGNSGTGKSYLFSWLSKEAFIPSRKIKCFSLSNTDSTKLIDELKTYTGYLVVIDNGDMLLTQDIRSFIENDFETQYLIFCRDVSGLGVVKGGCARLHNDSNEFTLERIL